MVIVFFSMSRQMGHMSSECSDRGETAISVPSMMASWPLAGGRGLGKGISEPGQPCWPTEEDGNSGMEETNDLEITQKG